MADHANEIDALAPDRLRREFETIIARASHDLRAPLSSIYMAILRLQEEAERGCVADRDCLATIAHSVESMLTMIDYLLDVKRLRSGKPRLRRLNIDMAEVGNSAVAKFRDIAALKGIAIRNIIPAGTASYADPLLMGQLFDNLLDNAIKYCREGDRVSVYAALPNRFGVADTGKGMDAERARSLFETPAHGGTGSAGETGLGLGLATCRAIVEAHGGRITACNGTSGGLTVEFAVGEAARRVLLVANSTTRLAELKQCLNNATTNLHILSVPDFAAAGALLRVPANTAPDLIVAEHDGSNPACLAFIHQVRRTPQSEHTRIWLVGPAQEIPKKSDWLRREALQAGADEFLDALPTTEALRAVLSLISWTRTRCQKNSVSGQNPL